MVYQILLTMASNQIRENLRPSKKWHITRKNKTIECFCIYDSSNTLLFMKGENNYLRKFLVSLRQSPITQSNIQAWSPQSVLNHLIILKISYVTISNHFLLTSNPDHRQSHLYFLLRVFSFRSVFILSSES